MLWWAQVKVLIPSFFTQWVLMVCLACGAWYGFTQIYTNYMFHWKMPVLVGSVLGMFFAINTTMNLYQNYKLVTFGQANSAQLGQTQPQAPDQPQVDPALQMKADFLKTVELFLQDPKQITDENKKKLFSAYGQLFPKGKQDKDMFYSQIAAVYLCQRQFWEDAMASYKAKQVVKSDGRKQCENLDGSFFNRPRLIPAEVVAKNDEMIGQLAARKRVPASDGKELNEGRLKEFIGQQARNAEFVRALFE